MRILLDCFAFPGRAKPSRVYCFAVKLLVFQNYRQDCQRCPCHTRGGPFAARSFRREGPRPRPRRGMSLPYGRLRGWWRPMAAATADASGKRRGVEAPPPTGGSVACCLLPVASSMRGSNGEQCSPLRACLNLDPFVFRFSLTFPPLRGKLIDRSMRNGG